MTCRTCGQIMVQKSRARLMTVGILMMATIAIAPFASVFWAPGIILALTGCYLVVWATLGRGLWCRNCKKFWPV